jgi:AcrR family transcriptional regulator
MAPPGPKGAGRPRDPEIDERVMRAARKLLSARGLRALTLDAIAETAGVSRTAIYRRWQSSDDLVLDALDDALGQLSGPDPVVSAEDFWNEVRDGVRTAIAGLSHSVEGDAIQFWLTRLSHQPKLHSRYWDHRVRPRRERAIESVHAAAAEGQIAASDNADLLVDMLAGLILYRYFLTPSELREVESDDHWLDRVIAEGKRLLRPPGQLG